MNDREERLLNESEVAALWGVTKSLLQKMRYERRGPRFVRIGRLVRYRLSDVNRYMEENSVGAPTGGATRGPLSAIARNIH